jgi:nucleoid-associated protein YgaU
LCAVLFLQFCSFQTRGQDVAEAARQEQARKAAQHKPHRHVYTEEDLKRQTILTPDDQARVEARKKRQNQADAEQNAQQTPDNGAPPSQSLGEIARRYRQEKAAREAELAAKKKFTPFPYEIPDPTLAAPKPGGAPSIRTAPRSVLNERLAPEPFPAPHSLPLSSSSRARISPFQPRPNVATPFLSPTLLAVVPAPGVRARSAVRVPEANPISDSPVVVDGLQRLKVQRGQSWWKLAELYLGEGARWPELRKLNADAGGPPELLMRGTTVVVPELKQRPVSSAPQTIKVRQGDSLWSLAHEYLGRGSAWTCLASANPQILDYTHLRIGASLQLPDGKALPSCSTERLEAFDHLQK